MSVEHRRARRTLSLPLAFALGVGFADADIPPNDGAPMVRIAYVIPSNRTPQPDGVANIQRALRLVHDWYGEQMWRWGFGYRSFRYETEEDGVTPLVHVLHVAETDAYLREVLWVRAMEAAYDAGATSIYDPGEVWVFFPETHLQLPSGEIIGGACWGGGGALAIPGSSGDGNGFAMVGTDALPFYAAGAIHDDTPYDGVIIPEIGPYPLVQDVTWAWFLGTTISSVSSSYTGALAHEMGHGLGLAHDWRNDGNFEGNLMFNGLRGIRGWLYPDDYPDDFTRLSYASALFSACNPYFTLFDRAPGPPRDDPDEEWPVITFVTSGDVDPVGGHLQIAFEASDNVGLVAARLRMNYDTIGELELSGSPVSAEFVTPYRETGPFGPGEPHEFQLTVYDAAGNTATAVTQITPGTGFNYAPQPWIRTYPRSWARAGGLVDLDASQTSDVNDPVTNLLVEWDLDGDGVFDTEPTANKHHRTTFDTVGVRVLRLRVTDPHGAVSVSTPVNLRVVPACPGDLDGDNDVDLGDLAQLLAHYGVTGGASYEEGDLDEDGDIDLADLASILGAYGTTCE
jgi:hypothetical protein